MIRNNAVIKWGLWCALTLNPGLGIANSPQPSQPLNDSDILYHLLTADMAAKRDLSTVAFEHYLLVAEATQDPEIARLATEAAIDMQSAQGTIQAVTIWANAAPDDIQAQLIAVSLTITDQPEQAQRFLQRAFATGFPGIDEELLELLAQLGSQGRKHLTDGVHQIADQNPTDTLINITAAQLSANQLDVARAEVKLNRALKHQPSLTQGHQLRAKLIRHASPDDKAALAYLDQTVRQYPNDASLRMFYATALLDDEQFTPAKPHLEQLSTHPVHGGEALLLLSEYYLQQEDFATATKLMQQAAKDSRVGDKALFYLGQVAEFQNDNQAAEAWYVQISTNSHFHVAASLRVAQFLTNKGAYREAIRQIREAEPTTLAEQKQLLLAEIEILIEARNLEQALQTANLALSALPLDVDFLYSRSLIANLLKKVKLAEDDLVTILTLQPEHANALNALGYTLSSQPNRTEEAMAYLHKAMLLSPNNPAFMDSMAWLLYQTGKIEAAREMLRDAYELSQDTEIAAHYGEVLWYAGDKETARSVLQAALQETPEHNELRTLMEKLQINLPAGS